MAAKPGNKNAAKEGPDGIRSAIYIKKERMTKLINLYKEKTGREPNPEELRDFIRDIFLEALDKM